MSAADPRLFGVLMTRDEAPLLRINIAHHLAAGCERIIVVDNGSSDETRDILQALARRFPVDWTRDDGPMNQSDVVTAMAAEARGKGADWILPLDTDEFWHQSRSYGEILARAGLRGVGALKLRRVEYIAPRDALHTDERALLRATRRVEGVLFDRAHRAEFERGERSMFELEPPAKLLLRTAPGLVVHRGAHDADGLAGPVEASGDVMIFHVPLPARDAIEHRIEHGRRIAEVSDDPDVAAQNRYWLRMASEGRTEEAWRAHSFADGKLDVNGRSVELIEDNTVERLLRPQTVGRLRRVLMRLGGSAR